MDYKGIKLDPSRDNLLTNQAKEILKDRYLYKGETFQELFARCALAGSDNLEHAQRLYDYFSKHWAIPSTPMMSNLGTNRGLPISCFLTEVQDDRASIYNSYFENCFLASSGGGIGTYWSNLRGMGAKIGEVGASSGIIPFIKVMDSSTLAISQGCVDGETEILTENGWIKFHDLNFSHGKVAQVNDDLEMSFVDVQEYHKYFYDGEMHHYTNKKDTIDLLVTPNHRMVVERLRRKSDKTRHWNGISVCESEKYNPNRYNRLYTAGNKKQGKISKLSPIEQFLIAYQAAGSTNPLGTSTGEISGTLIYAFRFRKERKIKRFESILNQCGFDFSKNYYDGTASFLVKVPLSIVTSNNFDWVDVSDKNDNWCKEFVEEVSLWNGNTKLNLIKFSNIIKKSCDVVCYVACLAGYKTYQVEQQRDGNRKPLHVVYILKGKNTIVGEKITKEIVNFSDNVFCVTVPSGMFLVRRNGRVLVTGNSLRRGSSAAYLNVHHPEIEEFIGIRTPSGGDINRKCLNIHNAICLTDEFMNAVENGTTYNLICPHTEETVKEIDARYIWQKILETRLKTGEPYIIFIDTVNKHIPEFHKKEGLFIKTSNLCLTGDTRIVTEEGMLTLEELYKKQLKFKVSSDKRTIDGAIITSERASGGHIKTEASLGISNFNSSTVFLTKKNVEVFLLKTKNGLELKGTKDHLIMTVNGWEKLGCLTKDSKILIQSGEGLWKEDNNINEDIDLKIHNNWIKKYEKIKFNQPEVYSQELGQLIGWIIGDGYIDKKMHNVEMVFDDKDEELILYFKKILEQISENVYISNFSNIPHLKVSDKRFGEFLLSLGVTTKKAHEKDVPECIFKANRETVIGFLQGLFSADGTANRTKEGCSIRLTSTSEKLLKNVQILLLNFGINGAIYHRRKAGKQLLPDSNRKLKEYNTKDLYELHLGKENRNLFFEKIGFLNNYKNECLQTYIKEKNGMEKRAYRELYEEYVESVTFHGIEDVFDISVEESHSFIANGIVVHNCSEITLPTNEERTAVCCLTQCNLERFDEWKDDKLFIEDLVRFADNVIDIFIYTSRPEMEKAAYSAYMERSIGIGIMGFHSYLQKNMIPFDSALAKSANIRMSKHIKERCDAATEKLAHEKGSCPDAARHGVMRRNANVTAIAPTTNTSVICGGGSPSGEPVIANAFNHKTLSGSFIVKNKYLEKLLEEKGMNNEEIWKDIVINEGSIMYLDCLTDEEKEVFKTAFEIDQHFVVDHASTRQKYVDQAISTNLFLEPNVQKARLHAIHFNAWKKGVKSLYYLRSKSIQRADKVGQLKEREIIEEELSSIYDECEFCQ